MNDSSTPKEQNQNQGKNPVKLIFHIILFLLAGILITKYEIEPITSSEKAIIIFSFVLTAVFTGTAVSLKKWLENETDKKGITLLKKSIAELWVWITALAVIITGMVSFHFLFTTLMDKMIFYDTGQHISVSDIDEMDGIMSISKITGNNLDSPTIYSSLLWQDTGNETASAKEIRDFFKSEFEIPLPETWCEKICNFLNTEIHHPAARFFCKWCLAISLVASLLCLFSEILFPALVKQLYIPALVGAISIVLAILETFMLIFIIGLPVCILYICAAFAFVTVTAVIVTYLWGLLIIPISVIHLITGCIVTVFEKIKGIFSKDEAETSAL